MNRIVNQFIPTGTRLAALALGITLAFAPGLAQAANPAAHEDRAEMRIKNMHAKLSITAAQEAQWGKVAQVMRDDAKTMDSMTQARFDHAKDMTAVDNLKSYAEITTAHAEGIKNLTPVFADLYAEMSDDQKTRADKMFRHGGKKRHGHGNMMSRK